MIDIEREGSRLVVRIEGSYPIIGKTWVLTLETTQEWIALLLWHNLSTALRKKLSAIRAEAYAQGWKDAKSHKKKADWFSERW